MYKVKHESLTHTWADELVSSLLRRPHGLDTSLADLKSLSTAPTILSYLQ